MKIDTLVLAGASTKVAAYVGILRALYEKHILTEELDGVKHIITCSIGLLSALFLLLKVPLHVQEEVLLRCHFLDLIDIENVHINDLLFNLGLFDNSKVASLVKGVLVEKYQVEDMTLQELYDRHPILLTTKCVNATTSCNAYLNVKTDPELSILTLLQMTTAIPIIFKPIEYKGELYVDGGLTGGYPTELVKDNYLGINICSNGTFTKTDNLLHMLPILPYLLSISHIKTSNSAMLPAKHTIKVITDLHFYEFDVPNEQKIELINVGYTTTLEHIQKHNLTNDNLTRDSDPTEGNQ